MKLLKPTYRLSRLNFFLCTFLTIPIILYSGGWFGPLVGFVLFLPYLQYIVRPRLQDMGHSPWWASTLLVPVAILALTLVVPVAILCIIFMMSVLLSFPGIESASQGKMERIHKIAVAIGIGLVAALIMLATYGSLHRPCGEWSCSYGAEVGLKAETEVTQSAMNAMMLDRNLTTVDEHTSGPAVNIWPGTLDIYMKRTKTKYYYCWDARGNVYPRSEDPDVAENPGECPRKP